MLMALGTFVFSLTNLAYQELQRSTSWRHASSARVGARPARQYVGPGEDSITLSGLLLPPLTGRVASLQTIRGMADAGRPLSLVDGTGVVHGAWVITELRETRSLLFADGTPRRIEFQISLERVDESTAAAG